LKVREHTYINGVCRWCGAKDLSALIAEARALGKDGEVKPDERSCIEREDYQSNLRPEPVRRIPACEDSETISARLAELAEERQPKCSLTGQLLYTCLRSSAVCGVNCPHPGAWIGPDPEDVAASC